MLYQKALVQLVCMTNGLHLLYLVHGQKLDTRFQFCISFFLFFKIFIFSNSFNLLLQHGAAVIDDKMYIFGGNHNGRYLSDLQVGDLGDLHKMVFDISRRSSMIS